MRATVSQRSSPTPPARAPTYIRPSGFRAPDERAIELTKFFLDSVQNTKYKKIAELGEKFGISRAEPNGLRPFLDGLFKGEAEKYLQSPIFFPFLNDETKTALAYIFRVLSSYSRLELVDSLDASKCPSWRHTEWHYRKVVMSLPTYLDWGEPINKEEKTNIGNKPDRFLAVMQHLYFIYLLAQKGVHIILIKPIPECPEMVFTRDVIFAVDEKILRANMVAPVRQAEQELVQNALVPPPEARIEWGNVFLDKPHNSILVGIGDRTNMEGAQWLQDVVGTDYVVIPMRTKEGVLHLDCAFSQVGQMLYPGALENPKDAELLFKLYKRLTVLDDAQAKFLLANLISVYDARWHTGFCLLVSSNLLMHDNPLSYITPTNLTPNIKPKADPNATRSPVPIFLTLDAMVEPVNLSEVTKAEGAHRCSTSPLL